VSIYGVLLHGIKIGGSRHFEAKTHYFALLADIMNIHIRITCIRTGTSEYFPVYEITYV